MLNKTDTFRWDDEWIIDRNQEVQSQLLGPLSASWQATIMHILHSIYVYFKCNYSRGLLSIIIFCTPSVCKTTVFETVSSIRLREQLTPGPPRISLNNKQLVLLCTTDIYLIRNCAPSGLWRLNNNNKERAFKTSDTCIHKYHSKSKCQNSLSARYWNQTRVGGTEGAHHTSE